MNDSTNPAPSGEAVDGAGDAATNCCGFFGRLFGHQFTACYDEIPTITNAEALSSGWAEEIISASKKRVFRIAFCQRCGLQRSAA